MNLPKIQPTWALFVGFIIGPIACTLNAILLTHFLGGPGAKLGGDISTIGYLTLFLTAPLGFQSTKLLEIWNKGQYAKARGMALGCGIFATLFWLWTYNELVNSQRWAGHNIRALFAALVLPFAWSMLFPILAVFARTPKD